MPSNEATPIDELSSQDLKSHLEDLVASDTTKKKDLIPVKRELEARIENEDKLPLPGEVELVYKGGSTETQKKLGTLLFKKAFDNLEKNHLLDFKDIKEGDKIEFEETSDNKPQVVWKQITKTVDERSFRQKIADRIANREPNLTTYKTDEVLIAINLNNSEAEDDPNTVVVAVVKHEQGVPNLDVFPDGGISVMSETKFNSYQESESTRATAKFLRGDLSCKEYKEEFKKESGRSITQFQNERDDRLKNEPDFWRSERYKGELISDLETNYTQLLQETQQKIDAIQTEIVRKSQETRAKNAKKEEMMNSPQFIQLLNVIGKSGTKPKEIDDWINIVARSWGVDVAVINKLLLEV